MTLKIIKGFQLRPGISIPFIDRDISRINGRNHTSFQGHMEESEVTRFMSTDPVTYDVNIKWIETKNDHIAHVIIGQSVVGTIYKVTISSIYTFNHMKACLGYGVIIQAS